MSLRCFVFAWLCLSLLRLCSAIMSWLCYVFALLRLCFAVSLLGCALDICLVGNVFAWLSLYFVISWLVWFECVCSSQVSHQHFL